MKLFLDYLPLILFFAVFKWAGASPEAAHAFANEHFSFLVAGGTVATSQAPIMLATVATILATLLQVVILLARRQTIDKMLWFSLAIVTVFGGATIYFNNEAFIKWKPTVLYWTMAAVILFFDLVLKKNLTRVAIDKVFDAPDALWRKLNLQWVLFFFLFGCLNLYVAAHYPTDTWVSFKLFGGIGLTLGLFALQLVPLMKYMKQEGDQA